MLRLKIRVRKQSRVVRGWATISPTYLAGDIVLVRGYSLISRLIRLFTRSRWERPTVVNHVGVMVDSINIVESAGKTIKHGLADYNSSRDTIYIVRRVDMTGWQRIAVAKKAETYVGRQYGWLKILAHGLDRLLGNIYLFRQLARMDKYPICSWVVAYAYRQVGLNFGVYPWVADPDDIWDYCIEKESKQSFQVIFAMREGRGEWS